MEKLLILGIAIALASVGVEGYGYLLNPPARDTAWRAGFNTSTDTNDMANFCGGKETQHNKNGGKCGVCGEEFLEPMKRLEPGPANVFATGVIVGDYKQGQTINVTIMITAYHKGYFEFRLCENDVPQKGKDSTIAVTYKCLNKNLLVSATTGETRFNATPGESSHQVKLPDQVTCSACVFQWRYRTGNNWGCEQDKCGEGVGQQEEFVGCSDIAILSTNSDQKVVKTTRRPSTVTKKTTTTQKTRKTSTTRMTREPTTQVTGRPVTQGPGKPVTQGTGRPVTQGTGGPVTQGTGRPVTQVTGGPVTQKAGGPVTQVTGRPVTQGTGRPVTQGTRKPTTQATRKPTTQATRKPTTQATRKPTTKATRKPTTRVTRKPTVITKRPVIPKTNHGGKKYCKGRAPYGSRYDDYCNLNCNWTPPYCPASHCGCSNTRIYY